MPHNLTPLLYPFIVGLAVAAVIFKQEYDSTLSVVALGSFLSLAFTYLGYLCFNLSSKAITDLWFVSTILITIAISVGMCYFRR